MSLQYVIDAYNLINHPAFKPATKSSLNIQHALANFIKFNKLTGSKNNQIILVFDGYPPPVVDIPQEENIACIFSRSKEADELIKKIIENSVSPKNIIVVTDDKEVQLASRFLHAQVSSIEAFICGKQNKKSISAKKFDSEDPKLSYSKMQIINAELAKKWLK